VETEHGCSLLAGSLCFCNVSLLSNFRAASGKELVGGGGEGSEAGKKKKEKTHQPVWH
jgi:hypothetical protein